MAFYQRRIDRIYRMAPPDHDATDRSNVFAGLWIKVNWLGQSSLPSRLSDLKERKLT